MPRWATKRTSGLSMPIPNAVVATTTRTSSAMKRSWVPLRSAVPMPAWYAAAATSHPASASATSSAARRVAT